MTTKTTTRETRLVNLAILMGLTRHETVCLPAFITSSANAVHIPEGTIMTMIEQRPDVTYGMTDALKKIAATVTI